MIRLLAMIALAGIGLLLLVEATARWWLRHRSRYAVWPPHMQQEIRLAREVFPDLEPTVRFDINSDGERGAEAPRDTHGLYRVLAAGGSAVECFALDQPKSWPAVLERLLNTPDSLQSLDIRRAHVGNIGHSGVGASELDLILKRVLPRYERLDVILIMVGASDVYHWLEDGAPASRPPSPVPEPLLFACHPQQPFGWNPRAWGLAELTRRVRRRCLHPVEVKANAGAWLLAGRRMRSAAQEIRPSVPDPAILLDYFERHFRQVLRRATARARRVLVVRQPWFEGDYTADAVARFWHGAVGKPWKEWVSVYFGLEVINRLLGLIDAHVVAVAEQLRVQHVNVRDLLNEGLKHYYDHDHFTPEGAAVVAHAVAAALTEPREDYVSSMLNRSATTPTQGSRSMPSPVQPSGPTSS